MEKITIDKIIAFIEKAMENNLNIKTSIRDFGTFSETNIYIYTPDDFKEIYIQYISGKDDYVLNITKSYSNWVTIKVSEMDIARLKVETLKAQEYSENKVIEYLNNFFKENSKPTDINDLDNEDD